MQPPIKYALSLVGTPWGAGGRSPECGLDCYGVVYHVFRSCLKIELPEYPGISYEETRRIDSSIHSEAAKEEQWEKALVAEDWQVVGVSGSAKVIHHVGVWLADGILHALPKSGVVWQTEQSLRANGLSIKHRWKHVGN